MAVLSDVPPCEFEPGASVLLNATVLDPATNARIVGETWVRFVCVDGSDQSHTLGTVKTVSAVALKSITYPADWGASAFLAEVKPEGDDIPQGISSSPVQLTVATETKLLLNVTNSGSQHTFRGWLKRNSGAGVPSETIVLKVNETTYVFSTTADGGFTKTLDLKPVNNNKTTFMISVSYNGSSPMNATAWTYTLNGTRYAACTTVYFEYKPSAKSTIPTADVQATKAMTATEMTTRFSQVLVSQGCLDIIRESSCQ